MTMAMTTMMMGVANGGAGMLLQPGGKTPEGGKLEGGEKLVQVAVCTEGDNSRAMREADSGNAKNAPRLNQLLLDGQAGTMHPVAGNTTQQHTPELMSK